jgi:hypothetical protein
VLGLATPDAVQQLLEVKAVGSMCLVHTPCSSLHQPGSP